MAWRDRVGRGVGTPEARANITRQKVAVKDLKSLRLNTEDAVVNIKQRRWLNYDPTEIGDSELVISFMNLSSDTGSARLD